MGIDELIEYGKNNDCSDIHLTSMGEIAMRQYGKLRKVKCDFTKEQLNQMIEDMLDEGQLAEYRKGKDLDSVKVKYGNYGTKFSDELAVKPATQEEIDAGELVMQFENMNLFEYCNY